MSWHIPVWLWLVHTALGGSVVLLLGCLAVRFIRLPALRLRVAELTLLGCLIVPFASSLPFVPRFSMDVMGSVRVSPVVDGEAATFGFRLPADVTSQRQSGWPAH